jgi:hypothetical protein
VLAREIVDFVATQLPARQMRGLADGGYATKECWRDLPASVDVVSRLLSIGKLYDLPRLRRSIAGVRHRKAPCWGRPTPSSGNAVDGSPTLAQPAPWSKPGGAVACGAPRSAGARGGGITLDAEGHHGQKDFAGNFRGPFDKARPPCGGFNVVCGKECCSHSRGAEYLFSHRSLLGMMFGFLALQRMFTF